MSISVNNHEGEHEFRQPRQPPPQRRRIQSFINQYGLVPPRRSTVQKLKAITREYYHSLTFLGLLNAFLDTIPLIRCVKEYKIRQYLVSDLISGVTVAIMNIPQGVAYGVLAGLSPSNGLYVSFFPPLIYMIFGTCPHISIGTFAIVSLMTAQAIHNIPLDSLISDNNNSLVAANISATALMEAKVGVATTLAFFVGLIQLILSFLRLGFITTYMTEPFINGLNVGAAVQVFSSQIPSTFGVPNPNDIRGFFKLPRFYVRVIGSIFTSINWVAFGITVSTIIILLTVKYFNGRYKSKIRIMIPVELILVIVGTIISHFLELHERRGISVVGPLKRGLPPPTVPVFKNVSSILVSAATIAAVSICLNISVIKLFSRKHGYKTSSNQELLAYGIGNIFSSFFKCCPSSGSLSRSVLQEESGAKTVLVNGISSIFLVIVILALTPLLQSLPTACLAGIIIANLKGLLFQITNFLCYFRISTIEGLLWLITFLTVVLSDVEYGLCVGLAVSFFMNTVRTQRPRFTVLGRVGDTHIFESLKVFPSAEQHPKIKILRFDGSLYACNATFFKRKFYELIGIQLKKTPLISFGKPETVEVQDDGEKYIVLDCSPMNFIDSVGVKLLIEIYKDLKKRSIFLYLAECRQNVRHTLDLMKFYEQTESGINCVSTHDAIMVIKEKINNKSSINTISDILITQT